MRSTSEPEVCIVEGYVLVTQLDNSTPFNYLSII
jgi:hypothetical protein